MNWYRVEMLDGYFGLYSAENEEEARETAIAATTHVIEGMVMDARKRRDAVVIVNVRRMNERDETP